MAEYSSSSLGFRTLGRATQGGQEKAKVRRKIRFMRTRRCMHQSGEQEWLQGSREHWGMTTMEGARPLNTMPFPVVATFRGWLHEPQSE